MDLTEALKKVYETTGERSTVKLREVYKIDQKELFKFSDRLAESTMIEMLFANDPSNFIYSLASTCMSLGIAMGMEIERAS